MRWATAFVAMLPAAYLYAKAAYGTLHLTNVRAAILLSALWATAEYAVRVPTNQWLRRTQQMSNAEMQTVWITATLLTSAMLQQS